MGRCLIIAVLTVATFVIVTYALFVHLWAVALGLVVAFLVWFWQANRGAGN